MATEGLCLRRPNVTLQVKFMRVEQNLLWDTALEVLGLVEINGDISPPDQKESPRTMVPAACCSMELGFVGEESEPQPSLELCRNLTENENSSSDSAETSAEESTEDEYSDGDDAENDREADQDSVLKATAEETNGEDTLPWPCCEKCKAIQNQSYECVNPRRISRGRLLALLEAEGTYKCSVTGLVFEVSQKAQVRYSVLSWSKFGMHLKDSWKFAGPIFDVDCDPAILKSIQFPHSLCLAGKGGPPSLRGLCVCVRTCVCVYARVHVCVHACVFVCTQMSSV
ncbi:hypothetical protein JZ751_002057 [Albula glossodonta]|uniref:FIIND domain-containing protein n=1 Tax=Albula glossodonta TaxID=121402 RepID=A0A8T2PFB2_9TELE|nr:hypothetical protein JZ751_002057 [Albula glossodonta]